jgi:hypothetical protein
MADTTTGRADVGRSPLRWLWRIYFPLGVLLIAAGIFYAVGAGVEAKMSLGINAGVLLILGSLDLLVGSKAKQGAAGR